jgi:GNAT superfamily N-acetyltransferase
MPAKAEAETEKPVKLTFKPVTKSTRDDFVALFESPSAPKYCWCMAWRADKEERKAPGPKRKPMMMKRIAEGVPVGILGYDKGKPVAWVSIAPKETYRNGLGGPETEDGDKIWSLVCMFLKKDHRGGGIAHQLIDAAVKQAKKRGATMVEAYPVDPDSPSYRYMGFVPAYVEAGFKRVGSEGSRRHVVRLTLKGHARAKS